MRFSRRLAGTLTGADGGAAPPAPWKESGVQCPVEAKDNAILVTKQASGSARIDPLMAAFNAIALMSTKP